MKRVYVLMIVVVLAVALTAAVWAAQEKPMPRPEDGMMMRGGMGMGGPAIAISSTNDIYVVHGGMIVKYDSDLNVVKQAELPMSERMMGEGRGMGMRRGGGAPGGRGGGGMRRSGGRM